MADRTASAAIQLTLLRGEGNPAQDRLYVTLAFNYGLVPAKIASYSGLPIDTVRRILVGS